jgi:hypothetical protein
MSDLLYRNALKVAAVLDNPAITADELKKVIQLCSVYQQSLNDTSSCPDTTLTTLVWSTSVLADHMLARDSSDHQTDWNTRAYGSAWKTWKRARIEAEKALHGAATAKTLIALGEMEPPGESDVDPATEWFEKGWAWDGVVGAPFPGAPAM